LNEFHTMNKTLEYMAMARPQVAFDLTEMRVSAGESALYAIPNDEADYGKRIVELLDDPGRREAMGRIGRERIESHLGWEHTHKNLLEAYSWLFLRRGRS
ncbi:MAG TPA: glycosyltransferase, partial [Chloroflexota bacterium]|nr:glycosyltransferase [Chloroflexota bacterium]